MPLTSVECNPEVTHENLKKKRKGGIAMKSSRNSNASGAKEEDKSPRDSDDLIIAIIKALFCLSKYQVDAISEASLGHLIELDKTLARKTVNSLMRKLKARQAGKPVRILKGRA